MCVTFSILITNRSHEKVEAAVVSRVLSAMSVCNSQPLYLQSFQHYNATVLVLGSIDHRVHVYASIIADPGI